jgi:hypothetical protein
VSKGQETQGEKFMRSRIISAVLVAALASSGTALILAGRGAAQTQSPFGDPDAAPAPFNPQFAALMNMLIQPRHAKLGLAGKAENWALAGYMFQELKSSFGVISRAVPRWKGLPVPDLIDAALTQPFAVLDFAIKAGEPRQFAESYDKVTLGCNNCHATMDHPYVVIKTPDASNFPNQDFTPKR